MTRRGGVAQVKQSAGHEMQLLSFYVIASAVFCGILTVQRHKGVWKRRDETEHVTACSRAGSPPKAMSVRVIQNRSFQLLIRGNPWSQRWLNAMATLD